MKTVPKRKKQDQAWHGFNLVIGRARVRRKDLPELTRSLATLLEAGVPLVQSLRTLRRQTRDPLAMRVLDQLVEKIEGGASFSEALQQYPASFNRLYVNMIRAGEASGALEGVLTQLANHLERADDLRSKVKAALAYPMVVLTVAVAITSALMIFIVPKFATVFTEITPGGRLPRLTEFVIAISNTLAHRFPLVLAGLVLLVAAYKLLRRSRRGNLLLDYISLNAPPFRDLVTKTHTAHFCSTLGTLLEAGVPVLNALLIVRDTAGNAIVARAVQQVHEAVREGEGMAGPMEASGVFPPLMVSMVSVGEQTGALPSMLSRIAATYERRVDRAVEALTALIEPLMIVLLGGIVGCIVAAMFLPLFEIAGAFTGN